MGNGLCLPSYADTEMSCCRYFDENDTCVFDCPGAPTYELFEEPPRMYCWKKSKFLPNVIMHVGASTVG